MVRFPSLRQPCTCVPVLQSCSSVCPSQRLADLYNAWYAFSLSRAGAESIDGVLFVPYRAEWLQPAACAKRQASSVNHLIRLCV